MPSVQQRLGGLLKRNTVVCRLVGTLFMGLLLSAGCALHKPLMKPATVKVQGSEAAFRAGEIIDLETGASVDFEAMMGILQEKDLVFLGEVHSDPEHHLMQVQILQRWAEDQPHPVIAMEFFQVTQQDALDRFLAGDLGEAAFLEAAQWDAEWGFPYHYYRPLLDLIRAKRGRILAINAPRGIVKKVARSGIESLSPEERAQIASEIDFNREAHREYVQAVFPLHPGHGGTIDFERFYQAQCIWEDTMAENIARFKLENPGIRIAVFAGSGHLRYGFGIPERTLERSPATAAVVLPYPAEPDLVLDRDLADFIWLSRSARGASGRHPGHPSTGHAGGLSWKP